MMHAQQSVQSETGRATAKLIATMLGGILVFMSFVAGLLYDDTSSVGGLGSQNVHRDLLDVQRAVVDADRQQSVREISRLHFAAPG